MRALTITWLPSSSIRPLHAICLYKEKHKINETSTKKILKNRLKDQIVTKRLENRYICNRLSELWSMTTTINHGCHPTSKLTLTNHAKNQLLPESIELTHVLSTFGFLADNPNGQNNMATTVVLYPN